MSEDRFPGSGDFPTGMLTPHPPQANVRTLVEAGLVTPHDSHGRDVATARDEDVAPRDDGGRDIVAAVLYYSATRALFGAGATPAAADDQPRIGKYTLERVIGSGGKGAVLLGRNPDLDEEVAVKVLRPDGRDDCGREGARLLREARTLARLVHPNIVPIHDAGTAGGLQYIVMRRVRGATLREAQAGAPWQRIVDLYLQAGRGLAAVHAAGLAHRDFKADNVLVEDDGRVMLADFGLVCVLGEPGPAVRAPHPGALGEPITRTGEIHGTPAYMAPEAFAGAPATVASDLFAFAASLFEALYREHPFAGEGLAGLAVAVLEGAVRPRPADSAVPDWLDAAVRRALLPEPTQRHASLPELLADLDFHARDRAAAEQRARTTRRRRLTVASVAAAVSGGLLGVFLAAAPDPCADPDARLADAWTAPTRAALLALGDPGARLVRLVDDHAAAWTATFTSVCTATHVDGTQSQELLDARMACLDQSRRELAALTSPLAHPDTATVDAALLAAANLDDPSPCARAVRVPQPRPDQAAAVAELSETLARVRVHELAGEYEAAGTLADSLVEHARAVDYGPLVADALVARGRVRRQTDAWAAARDDLSAALDLGERHGLDALAVEATSQLTKLAALDLRLPDLAHEWARQADRKLARAGGDDGRRADLLNNRGLVAYTLDSDYPQARSLHEQALHLREALQASGVESRLRVAESHYNLGNVLCALGDLPSGIASYRESRRINAEVLGPEHPILGEMLRNEADELRRLGDLETALARADEAIALLTRKPAAATSLAHALHLASFLHAELGQLSVAEDLARRALAILADRGPLYARDLAEMHSGLATVLQRQGRGEEARREYDAGLDSLATAPTTHPDIQLALLFNRGELQVELHRIPDALADFAAARRLLDEGGAALAAYRPYVLKGIGTAHLAAAHPEAAVEPLREALALVPPAVDPQLRAAIEQHLAMALPPSARDEARRHAAAAEATFLHLHDDASLAAVRRWLAASPPL